MIPLIAPQPALPPGYLSMILPDGSGGIGRGVVPIPQPVYRELPGRLILPPRAPIRPRWRAAISFVNGATAQATAATTGTVNKPTNTADNDLMILCIHSSPAGGISAPVLSGWNWLSQGTQAGGLMVGLRIASSEGSSYSPTWTTARDVILTITSWRGVDTDWAHSWLAHSPQTSTNIGSNTYVTRQLLFQACSYYYVSAYTHGAAGSTTLPTSFSSAADKSHSANSVRGIQAYRALSDTQNGAAVSWTSSNGSNSTAWAIALRGRGVTALSLKTASTFSGATGTTSVTATAPTGTTAGDFLVICAAGWLGSSGSDIAINTPSGWTKKGTDQYRNAVNARHSGCVLYRVADGTATDSPAVTVGTAEALIVGMIVFGTGVFGPDAAMPGTMGQSTDSTADATLAIPAMTLSAYAEANIVLTFATLNQSNQPNFGAPSGTLDIQNRGGTTSDSGYVSAVMNTSANPGATTWTSAANFLGLGFQFAVGVDHPNPTSVIWLDDAEEK